MIGRSGSWRVRRAYADRPTSRPENLTSPSHVVGVALHECLHVIFDAHNLGKMKRDKEEREEAIVMGFEAGLVSLFRDNPKLLTWMKKWL